jgi:hypothetical protein
LGTSKSSSALVPPAILATIYPNVLENGFFQSGKKDKASKVVPNIKVHGKKVALKTGMGELHLD